MKTLSRIATTLLISLVALNVFAKPVTVEKANQIGQSFFAQTVSATGMLKTSKSTVSLKYVLAAEGITLQQPAKASADTIVPYYIFTTDSAGYVIISGDDRVIPVLGYAERGNFDPDNIPPAMQKWLEGYKSEIRYVIENNIEASAETKAEWLALQQGTQPKSQNLVTAVSPLVSTSWNQSPYYNNLCPYDNSQADRTVTGCVATAMAQVMKYWNYPTTGSGFHSFNHATYGTLSANFGSTNFDWADMPNQLSAGSSAAQKSAVATLMYHCGVSVDMNYGVASTGGSGAYVISSASPVTHCTEYALKTYFGYKNTIQGLEKVNYTNTAWTNLLKTELDAGRPMVYAGFGDGGHCFVCDGYDNNNYFHFNWGWGGYYDGYFALNALNPGSGGIGGGSYSYNDGQQAVIGIEPVSGGGVPSENYDLRLYSSLTMPDVSVWFTSYFSLNTDVANYGTGSFSGQFGAAIFDEGYNFVDFIEVKTGMTLGAGNHYTDGITFTNAGSAAYVPGTYYASLFYKTTTQDWTIVANGSYTNLIQFDVIYSSDIEVNSVFDITTNGGTLVQGQSATINVDVLNTGASTFYGKYRVNLANLDGSWAQNIQILNENSGLAYNYHYIGGNDFTGTITVAPGTYLMELAYQTQGSSSWYYAGSTNYSNPVYVIVKSEETQADIYENNNSQVDAYTLPVSFAGSSTSKNSDGSNLHVGTDIDYFKIVLPQGYNYYISPRLHDSYNSANGQSYTVDALFSYSVNGVTYSQSYDDVISGNIVLVDGGTVYFKVAPYFSGNTGTYLLDMSMTRGEVTGLNESDVNAMVYLYPNPAKNFVMIELHESIKDINQISLCNTDGKQVYIEKEVKGSKNIRLPLQNLPNGVYFVKIHSDNGVITKKLVIDNNE